MSRRSAASAPTSGEDSGLRAHLRQRPLPADDWATWEVRGVVEFAGRERYQELLARRIT